MVKVGINGFGRIGRMVFRATLGFPEIEVVGINDPFIDPEYMAYQFKYDSVHGRAPCSVEVVDGVLTIAEKKIKTFAMRNPGEIDWASTGAEIVVEATGIFRTEEAAKVHLGETVKHVIISAPAADKVTPMFVYGVNHQTYNKEMKVVSNASCTTNCLAPVAYVLNKEYGLENGLMTTIHSVTATQKTVDGPVRGTGNKWRSGRCTGNNIIPASTGAAIAVGVVLPELQGKLTGMAMRVPTPDVSVVDLTVNLKTPTTYEEICATMKKYSETSLEGVLGYTTDPVVSSDFIGHPITSVFDASAGIAMTPTFYKFISWYDNEMGYSTQLVKFLCYMAKQE
ncbi:glyceraldehyde-3-phosphate dehydrogenase, type I [Kipferlia bialata]|uniref:Glyceraldehyde-3-phosphate dehydrogenase n=1 Tax=Kipferlia bialata TaxID=797122 RepID=A0A391NMD2_9EUKA|nr:glyceraldehyde-3-phosphate dehydrogenase, type I [Kipferlia bialata]|eukprot:g6402.t1